MTIDSTKPLSLNDLQQWQPVRPPELIANGILPKGHIMFFYGDQETYKSWLAINLAFKVAEGKNWLVHRTQPAKILILNPELPAIDYRDRVISYINKHQVTSSSLPIYFWTNLEIYLNEQTGRAELINYTQQYKPDLIIVDGLEFVCRGDIATYTVAEGFKTTINQIRKLTNSSFLFVHHKRKGAYDLSSNIRLERGIDDMYGHSLIKNMADTVLEISKESSNENIIKITPSKLRLSQTEKPAPLHYYFDRDSLEFKLELGELGN